MDRQHILNTVAEKLIEQGVPAMVFSDDMGMKVCAYRGDDGRRCAVGHLIPDYAYRSDMENVSVDLLIERGWMPEGLRDAEFLEALQGAHDNADPRYFCSELSQALYDIADAYNLTPPAACEPYLQGEFPD